MVSVIEKVNEMKRGKQWLVFFGSAIVALLVLLIPFVARGHHLVWVAQAGDAATQGVTFLNRLREVGWFKAIGSYDFYLGLGSDFLTSMSFFSLFDPFNVLVFIFPFDIVWVYDIIMLLKFIAAGAAIFIYLHWRKVKGGYSVALSLIYMFTGFLAFTFVRHLNLTSGAIYLPLMIMGLEQVYQKKNPFVFIGFSFLCLINSFYMFFFNSVFVVLFCCGGGAHILEDADTLSVEDRGILSCGDRSGGVHASAKRLCLFACGPKRIERVDRHNILFPYGSRIHLFYPYGEQSLQYYRL